jgi:hypothetical protein
LANFFKILEKQVTPIKVHTSKTTLTMSNSFIGNGVEKFFYQIKDTPYVVAVPNKKFSFKQLSYYLEKNFLKFWIEKCSKEIIFAKFFSSLNIPTTEQSPAILEWEIEGQIKYLPTYYALNFLTLDKGIVLDRNTTQKTREQIKDLLGDFFTSQNQTPLWISYFERAYQDIKKLMENGFELTADAATVIVYNTKEIGLFLFDFTSLKNPREFELNLDPKLFVIKEHLQKYVVFPILSLYKHSMKNRHQKIQYVNSLSQEIAYHYFSTVQ